MADNKHRSAQAAQPESPPRMYPPDLQPMLQALLGTLADINFEYEHERETITARTMDMNLKIRMLEKLRQHHHQRREPYIQHLALLQEHIRQACR